MDWRNTPSLAALRAYEAAARTGSLSAAARELNVTHVAISQHVRQLEKHFGTALLVRDGQRMVVPDEARPFAEALTSGFGQIAAAARDLADRGAEKPLRIATTPSFASGWLMPRMSDFWQQHPTVEVEVLSSHGLVDLGRDRVDIALRYGHGNWRGVQCEWLMSAEFLAVARPGLVPKGSSLAELSDMVWLGYSPFGEEFAWLESQGVKNLAANLRGFSSAALVVEAVKGGVGIGVVPRPVVAGELQRGEVEVVGAGPGGTSDPAYHILTQPGVHRPVRDIFIKWLKAAAKA